MDRPRDARKRVFVRAYSDRRRFVGRLVGGGRTAQDAVSGHPGHRFRAQLRASPRPSTADSRLRKARSSLRWTPTCQDSPTNPRAAPHDPRRGLRPGLGVEKETPRPDRQTLAQQILQLDGPGRVGHPAPRFQLRAESLPPQGGEGHRGLRRDATASFRSWPSRPGSAASARRSSTIAPAKYGSSKSASNAR